MLDERYKTAIAMGVGVTLFLWVLFSRPEYLADPSVLGVLLAAELVLAAVFCYRKVFFFVLISAFLWAGLHLPFQGAWLRGRWAVLAVGALVGVPVYVHDRQHHRFSLFHLVAFFCVLSAAVSALVSRYPEEAGLKAVSLMALFLYGSTGARVVIAPLRSENFFRLVLRACEAITCTTAISYLVLHAEIFGNPNSLGAVMGVVVVPVLAWGVISAEDVAERRRCAFILLLALVMLFSSFARAGMAAAAVSCVALCIATRNYRLMAKGAAAVAAIALITAMFLPREQDTPRRDRSQSVVDLFLYKGKPQQGVMASRKGPWDETVSVIKRHPWFGSGFGTSVTGEDLTKWQYGRAHVASRATREHGNSYLAITEWVGLLGVVPFYALMVLVALNAGKVLLWLRRTGEVWSPAVPAAIVLLGGFVDAMFEDWMFAVGYYLSVFFWVMAFMLVDLAPEPSAADSRAKVVAMPEPYFAEVAAGQ